MIIFTGANLKNADLKTATISLDKKVNDNKLHFAFVGIKPILDSFKSEEILCTSSKCF